MSFWNVRQPVCVQHLSHARRIPFAHLVDAKCELHADILFTSKFCEQGVLGRTCATAFAQDEPKLP